MPRIVGVDIAIKNLALCSLNSVRGEITLEKSSLLRPRSGDTYTHYEPWLAPELVHRWIEDRFLEFFADADLVIIEQQPTYVPGAAERRNSAAACNTNNMIMNLITGQLMARGTVVSRESPRSVKLRCGVPCAGYALNKRNAVRKMNQILGPSAAWEISRTFDKEDDVADALLLALYGVANFDVVHMDATHQHPSTRPPVPLTARNRTTRDVWEGDVDMDTFEAFLRSVQQQDDEEATARKRMKTQRKGRRLKKIPASSVTSKGRKR